MKPSQGMKNTQILIFHSEQCLQWQSPPTEGGHDLAALEARADGQRGEDDLQQERRRGHGMTMMQDILDNAHAGAKVHIRPQQRGEHKDDAAAGEDTDIGIFDMMIEQVLGLVQRHTEQNAAKTQKRRKQHDLKEHQRLHRRNRRQLRCA